MKFIHSYIQVSTHFSTWICLHYLKLYMFKIEFIGTIKSAPLHFPLLKKDNAILPIAQAKNVGITFSFIFPHPTSSSSANTISSTLFILNETISHHLCFNHFVLTIITL